MYVAALNDSDAENRVMPAARQKTGPTGVFQPASPTGTIEVLVVSRGYCDEHLN